MWPVAAEPANEQQHRGDEDRTGDRQQEQHDPEARVDEDGWSSLGHEVEQRRDSWERSGGVSQGLRRFAERGGGHAASFHPHGRAVVGASPESGP